MGRGGSKVEVVLIDSHERWGGELFDASTTPSLLLLLLQFIHTVYDRGQSRGQRALTSS